MNLFSPKKVASPTQTDLSKENLTLEPTPKTEHPLTEIIRFSVIALLIVIPVRMFIAQPFIVSGASMEDTFYDKEYLIVDQLTYHLEDPRRGDVIVFRYPRDESKFFIKRVIGLPGDTLAINGHEVSITNSEHPDGVVLDEPYINTTEHDSFITKTLADDEYFVMGDNRDQSSDSRMWGTLKRNEIIGRVLLRLFPITRADVFPGEFDTDTELLATSPS